MHLHKSTAVVCIPFTRLTEQNKRTACLCCMSRKRRGFPRVTRAGNKIYKYQLKKRLLNESTEEIRHKDECCFFAQLDLDHLSCVT